MTYSASNHLYTSPSSSIFPHAICFRHCHSFKRVNHSITNKNICFPATWISRLAQEPLSTSTCCLSCWHWAYQMGLHVWNMLHEWRRVWNCARGHSLYLIIINMDLSIQLNNNSTTLLFDVENRDVVCILNNKCQQYHSTVNNNLIAKYSSNQSSITPILFKLHCLVFLRH